MFARGCTRPQSLQSILKHEGPRGLYRGLLASLCGIVPYSGTDLTVYSILKVRLSGVRRRCTPAPQPPYTCSLCPRTRTRLDTLMSSQASQRCSPAALLLQRAGRWYRTRCSWCERASRCGKGGAGAEAACCCTP